MDCLPAEVQTSPPSETDSYWGVREEHRSGLWLQRTLLGRGSKSVAEATEKDGCGYAQPMELRPTVRKLMGLGAGNVVVHLTLLCLAWPSQGPPSTH